jgi:hypothetical protein
MDTVTLVRSAIRALLAAADAVLAVQLRAVLARDDDYAAAGKPVCDYDDPAAREQLVDALARDGLGLLQVLEGRVLDAAVRQAGELLATVIGQDLAVDESGMLRIVRRVARDRVISTVDPQTRHGHKTAARGFDGYKGHVGIDPDSEIITATRVTPGNAGDASVAEDLIADLQPATGTEADDDRADAASAGQADAAATDVDPATVYGDNAYGTGEFQARLAEAGIESKCKTQPSTAAGGLFTKDAFDVDLDTDIVTCPNKKTAKIQQNKDGSGTAQFGKVCPDCPLRAQCTKAAGGRTITVGRHERRLAEARQRQADPDWTADYRATRPKVERKLAHLMRRRHGGRRARVRGQTKIAADFALLAAAVNLARLSILGVTATAAGPWAVVPS